MKIVTHLKVAGTLVNIHSYMISGSISLVNIHSLRGRSRLASITTTPHTHAFQTLARKQIPHGVAT